MKTLQQIIEEMEDDISKARKENKENFALGDYNYAFNWGIVWTLEKHIQKLTLLLKDESKQPQPPDCANTMLGEVPHVVNAQPGENLKAVEGATPVVRQNEQTKEVRNHELVYLTDKKRWFCWNCRQWEEDCIPNRCLRPPPAL